MSAASLIAAAANASIELRLDGDGLRMKATTKPPDELITKIREHKVEIVALLHSGAVQPAWWALPHPRIVVEPPFGLGEVPPRLHAAWLAVLSQCPLGIEPMTWEIAVFDAALLIGDFGALIEDYRWTPGDLFEAPAGLVWFIK